MERYLSVKLKVLSFFLMICVVFFHAHNLNTGSPDVPRGYSLFIQNLLGDGFTRIAVPLFFTISGYLFFLNLKGTAAEFVTKFKKRFKSLFIPYVFWSLWGLCVFFILQSLPQSRQFFNHGLIADFTVPQLFHTIFLDPLSYQLWFLKDLITLIIVSPVIYKLLKYTGFILLIILTATWLYNLNYIIFLNESVLFYTIGAFVSLKKNDFVKVRFSSKSLILTFLWILLVVSKTIFSQLGLLTLENFYLTNKITVIFGIPAIWSLYDVLFSNKDLSENKYFPILSYTFFLYGFHEPLLTILKKGFSFVLGKSEIASLMIYFITAIMAISISIAVGYCLSRIAPKFYSLITGGR